MFIGGLIFGNLADRYGRRPVFAWNLAAFVVLSLLQYLVQDMWQLVVLRLALGLAIGVEYAVGTAVLAEFSRRRGRGVLLGSFALAWQIGFSVAFFVGMAYEGDNWRLLLASSAIPAAITFLLRLGLPESPMWLKARGREQVAEDIVRRHFGTGYTIPTIALEETHPRRSSCSGTGTGGRIFTPVSSGSARSARSSPSSPLRCRSSNPWASKAAWRSTSC